jgi:hypothetical protein
MLSAYTLTRRFIDRLALALPFLPGLAAFLIVVGPRALDPRNLGWLRDGDPSTHYLGWLFFRQADWTFPPGLNPGYGLELASSIVYTDSIPLLALFFKLFDAWLPQPFQYLGLWLLACFVLQGYFAWKLAGLMSTDTLLRLPASILLVFAPPMLWRLGGHWSLVGHFLILAGLYLTLRPGMEQRRLAWGGLLATATLVHAYFVVMLSPIWLADLATRTWQRRITPRDALIEVPSMLLLVVTIAWLGGYFAVGSGLADGDYYGYFRANLLTFVDPSGWSYVLKDLPESAGDYEGFNYLGLGVILLALTALPQLHATGRGNLPALARQRYLLLALAVLAAFAFTNKLGLGALNFSFPVPEFFSHAAETFRSSGRMLWPVFYGLVLAILYAVIKGNGRSVAATLLVLAAVVQVADTHPAWSALRQRLMASRQDTLVNAPSSPFWEEAAGHYANIRVLPPGNAPKHWVNIAEFAGTHGMGTNAAYLARVDHDSFANASTQSTAMLASGDYAADTLYILDESVVEQARLSLHADEDLLQEVDGVFVIAPGWQQHANSGEALKLY